MAPKKRQASPSRNLDRFAALVRIMACLRGPQGCPWDREQTHDSLKPNLLEEAYEVLQSIEEKNPTRLCEELGDLLMQIVFHAQMSAEAEEFTIKDVVRSINRKLIHRHPHIFGDQTATDARQVALNWEALKKEERRAGDSLLVSVPPEMPALACSQAIQHRVAQVGFDWPQVAGVLEKLVEELTELQKASSREEREKEFGDLLFTLVNVGRHLGVDLESALRQANRRFYRRFAYMEERCRQDGLSLADLSFDQQNVLWEEAKKKLSD